LGSVHLQCSLRPLARFKGLTSKGSEGRKDGRKRQGRGRPEKRRDNRGGEGKEGKRTSKRAPSSKFATKSLGTPASQPAVHTFPERKSGVTRSVSDLPCVAYGETTPSEA